MATNLIQALCRQLHVTYSGDMKLKIFTGTSEENLDEQFCTWRNADLDHVPGQGYSFLQKDEYMDEENKMVRYVIYRPYYGEDI